MRISEAKECIKALFTSTKAVTALISERGVGKTSAYEQCAAELNMDYIALYAAALEGPDFMGLPAKDLDKGITRYLAPQFLPTQAAINSGLYKEEGILVLEEINRVPSDTISVLYPLLLEHKINGHELGQGWHIGVTMNPDTMNYLVNALDDAMLDRFISIAVEPSIDDYIDFSRQNNGNDRVLDFLKSYPDMLLITNKANDGSSTSKAPTPRGWTKVQEILNKLTQLPDDLVTELITGIVGPIASAALLGYKDHRQLEMPDSKVILEDYRQERAKVLTLLEQQQTPVLTKVIDNLITRLDFQAHMVNEVDAFLSDLPDELSMYFYKSLSREDEALFDFFSDRSLVFDGISGILIERMVQ